MAPPPKLIFMSEDYFYINRLVPATGYVSSGIYSKTSKVHSFICFDSSLRFFRKIMAPPQTLVPSFAFCFDP